MPAFIPTGLHKSFRPFFIADAREAGKAGAAALIGRRPGHIADRLDGDHLFGARFSVADAHPSTMLTWARKNGIDPPAPLPPYFDRVVVREAVQAMSKAEG